MFKYEIGNNLKLNTQIEVNAEREARILTKEIK